MARGKSANGTRNDPEKSGKGNDKGNNKKESKVGASNVAKRLTAELQRLRGLVNGELEAAETTRLVCELTSESNLDHSDPHARLLIASCIAELLRITAPETPFESDNDLYEVFVLIIRVLREATDEADIAWFGLLETLATVKMCNLAVGLGPEGGDSNDDLVIDLFKCLFESIQEDHSVKVETNMVNILVGCLEEFDVVSLKLLETILNPLLHSDEHPRAYHMAQKVIENAAEQLQTALSSFFNSVLIETPSHHSESDLKDHTHTLIYETHKIQPGLLLYVLPNVCLQLQVDDMETRSNAIALMGRLFASSHADYGAQYMKNFREFLGRFRDVKKEIRLQMVQVCSIIAQRKPDLALLIDTEMLLRLQDPEWEVRRLVVNEVCDLAAQAMTNVSMKCLREVGERMKDKKVIIRKEAMTGLAQIYAAHVSTSWSNGNRESSNAALALSWVPDYVLKCFAYPQQELRLRVIQLLDDILLPKQSTELYRMKGLIYIWSQLDGASKEALRRIFMERSQCRNIILKFIELKQQARGKNNSTHATATNESLNEMHQLFPETEGINSHIEKLVAWKDMKLVKHLSTLCSPSSDGSAIRQSREDLVKMVGSKTPLGDFMKGICRKLAMTTVNTSSLGKLLSIHGESNSKSCVEILHLVGTNFPFLIAEHLDVIEQQLSNSNQVLSLLDLLISYAKRGDSTASHPASLKKTLLSLCSSETLEVVKRSARALYKLFPLEIPVVAKKLLKSPDFTDAKLQTLVVLTKQHINRMDEASLFEKIVHVYEDAAKKRDVKSLALSLLTNLVIHYCHDNCRQVLDMCFHTLEASTSKASSSLRLVAACNVLKLARVADFESQIKITEWHTLGYVLTDQDDTVRRVFLKKLKSNLMHHTISHKYLCIPALAASEPEADLKREAKILLHTAVQRMRRMYEARTNAENSANSIMVPEYTLPYMIHLVIHSPWKDNDMDPLYFMLESLVSHVSTEADNISFLLQMLHKMALCHDVIDPSSALLYKAIDGCTTWLKKRIKNQINLKPYPGQIFLPKQLFQPGKIATEEIHDENEDDSPIVKEKKRSISMKQMEKPAKKQKMTSVKPASPRRRMPSRSTRSDNNLADQDSDVEQMREEEVYPIFKLPKPESNNENVNESNADKEETKAESDDDTSDIPTVNKH